MIKMSIQGRVVEYWTSRPVQGAVVSAGGKTAVTDSAGTFSLEVPTGVINLSITHDEFHPFTTSLNITSPRPFNVGLIRLQSRLVAL